MKQTKVAANFVQDFSEPEKAQARANIGAAASADIPAAPVQSNWNETNTSSLAYIQNKPTIPPSPVQSDWDETNTSSLAYILNKPDIPDNVYLAEYGVATVADISAAKNAGKVVITLIPGTYYSTVAYLREVTRNGASANFASVVSDSATVRVASVTSAGVWSSSTVNLAETTSTSLIQKLNYGDTEPSRVNTLLIDSDDPEGYALLKADNVTKGNLVMGPYKGLLDSGINNGSGLGSSTTPLYIDGNSQFVQCDPLQKELTAGYRISIGPGAQNTTVIANTMHESVVNSCLIWDTLANSYDYDYYWGNWRVHVHLKAFSDWANADEAIHIRIEHAYKSEASTKIKLGSYQVQNYLPFQNGNSYDFTNSHWYYDGADPYTTATLPDPYGFTFHINPTTPDRNMPTNQQAHRFLVDTGAPYGEWLELDASVRFLVPNAAPSGNAIYLLMKAKYAYSYV